MTRRQEIIATLLEWYEAVLNSWQGDWASEPFGFPRVNAILRHPSYVELERLLVVMREDEPVIYWNITQRYLYAPSKVVLRCSVCGPAPKKATPLAPHASRREAAQVRAEVESGLLHVRDEPLPPFGVDKFHTHGRKVSTLRPVRVRVPSLAIRPELVTAGIKWLDEHWRDDTEPFVPDFEAKRVAA